MPPLPSPYTSGSWSNQLKEKSAYWLPVLIVEHPRTKATNRWDFQRAYGDKDFGTEQDDWSWLLIGRTEETQLDNIMLSVYRDQLSWHLIQDRDSRTEV